MYKYTKFYAKRGEAMLAFYLIIWNFNGEKYAKRVFVTFSTK